MDDLKIVVIGGHGSARSVIGQSGAVGGHSSWSHKGRSLELDYSEMLFLAWHGVDMFNVLRVACLTRARLFTGLPSTYQTSSMSCDITERCLFPANDNSGSEVWYEWV